MARQLSDHNPNFLYSTSMPCHGPSGHVKVEVLRKGELLDLDIELKSQPHLVLASKLMILILRCLQSWRSVHSPARIRFSKACSRVAKLRRRPSSSLESFCGVPSEPKWLSELLR